MLKTTPLSLSPCNGSTIPRNSSAKWPWCILRNLTTLHRIPHDASLSHSHKRPINSFHRRRRQTTYYDYSRTSQCNCNVQLHGGPAKLRPTHIFDGNIWMHRINSIGKRDNSNSGTHLGKHKSLIFNIVRQMAPPSLDILPLLYFSFYLPVRTRIGL